MNKYDYLITPIKEVLEKIAYLDDLESFLEFPQKYVKSRQDELPLMVYNYGAGMSSFKSFGKQKEESEEIGIINLAHALTNFHDQDWLVEEVLKTEEEHKDDPRIDDIKEYTDRSIFKGTRMLRSMLYDYISVINYGMPISKLLSKARRGNEDSFLKLVRIDKSIILFEQFLPFLSRKQYEADWEFFDKLGKAISARPLKEEPYLLKAVILVARFWEEHFKNIPYKVIVEILEDLDVLPRGYDHRTFSKHLNRLGLKKYRYNKK